MEKQGKSLRPPVKWHGGKFYLCHRIIEQFPQHHTYVEPFGGAASVLLNKPPAVVEVYNDLDKRITRLFRVLRDHGQEFQRRLALTPYSEIEFDQAEEPTTDEIEQARRDFVRLRLSLGGRGDSFSFTLHRVRRGMADVVSGYLSGVKRLLHRIGCSYHQISGFLFKADTEKQQAFIKDYEADRPKPGEKKDATSSTPAIRSGAWRPSFPAGSCVDNVSTSA